MMEDSSCCIDLIEFFEHNKDLQKPGSSGAGNLDGTAKKSTDITIYPLDLEDDKFQAVSTYMEELKTCYLDYLEEWEVLKTFLARVHISPFNIQKYDTGGHFRNLHAERTSIYDLHRVLVWMTYLNDVPDGGETVFPLYEINVKPQKGKTLIWPAEWTHSHFGAVVNKGNKYIITGWMHFPDDA
jgi:hypothetical protein